MNDYDPCEDCEPADRDCDTCTRGEPVEAAETSVSGLVKLLRPGITEDALTKALELSASRLADLCLSDIRNALKGEIQKLCGEEVRKRAAAEMETAFGEVMAEKIVQDATKWNQKTIAIREVIREEMKKFMQGLGSESTRKNLVNDALKRFMDEEVQKAVKSAVAEFRKDYLDDFGKQAMSGIVMAVAHQIGTDKKMLALLQA